MTKQYEGAMISFAEDINRDIEGEQLLYAVKESYTKEESELIIRTLAKRMSKRIYFSNLVDKYQSIIIERILPNIEDDELVEEKRIVAFEMSKNAAKSLEERNELLEYAVFCEKYKLGILDSYYKTMSNAKINVVKFEEALKREGYAILYRQDTNFLLTANIIFSRYPEFYTEEYVLTLTDRIRVFDKKGIPDKTELQKYKFAEKTTLKHIKNYTKNKRKANRANQKVKKI